MQSRIHTVVLLSLVLVGASLPTGGSSTVDEAEDAAPFGTVGQAVANVTGPVDEVIAPTSAAPQFRLVGETLRIELDEAPADPIDTVDLEPSFGDGPTVTVDVDQGDREASTLWEGPYARSAVPLTGEVPAGTQPGLYDVVVPDVDRVRRAVSIHEEWPETPKIVLLADTQTNDPRALRDGTHGSFGVDPLAPHEAEPRFPPDPAAFNESMERTYGIDVLNLEIRPEDRWGSYRAAIERINEEIQPDLVLFSGDLNFGQLAPGSWHVEYEESWALLNGGTGVDGTQYEGIHAPTLLSPGNHDGYIQSGEDGLAFWEAYFGPPAFSTTFSNVTLVSINTYDWSNLDRMGIAYAVSAWGGQIRGEQLGWLRAELCLANGGQPDTDHPTAIAGVGCQGAGDERVITFSHHSPSWVQDDWPAEYGGFCQQAPCQGTPVFEQFTRGFVSFTTTGQAWSGENRLALRDTLREFDVDLHAAGHTHRDRIARDVGDGTIVETPQQPREGLRHTQLHLVQEDGTATEIPFGPGADLIRNGTGPLYIETTTAASETDAYFGLRPVVWHEGPHAFPDGALGVPPFETGFPMTSELLDQIAREPSHWNASHAEIGLFSTPTFLAGG